MTVPPEAAVPAAPARPVGRPFVSRFLLPLVKGGTLHVGRPLGPRAVEAMAAAWKAGGRRTFASLEDMAEEDALTELGRLRQVRARALVPAVPVPPLDEDSVRLGAAVHNLLALGHPDLGAALGSRSLERRQEQIVDATLPLADLGPPRSVDEALRRHSLLARLGEITRTEHIVEYWAGRRRFIGRPPPAHLVALPRVRRVATTSVRRLWFKEIGVPGCGRPLLMALHRASPLAEALDPTRFDPPVAWERILPILRFPALCRVVAGQLLELGLESASAPLVTALVRLGGLHASAGGSPEGVGFAIRFLAHTAWLQQLYGGQTPLAASSELAALLVAAADVDPTLVWPADVNASSPIAADFRARLEALGAEVRARHRERYQLALGVVRFTASTSLAER
jgi:hypothetical protein